MRCSFCHDALDRDRWTCSSCGTGLHTECRALMQFRCPTLGCMGQQPGRRRRLRRPGRPEGRGVAFGFDVAAWVLSAGTGISAVASAIVTVILDNGSRGAPAFAWAVTLLLGAAHFLVVPALLHAGQQRSQGSRLPWRRRLRAALAYVVPSILIVSFVSFLGCWFLGSVFEHGLGLLAGICLGCVVPGLSGSVATRAWVALREAPSSRGARTEQTRPALAPGLSIRVRACAEDFAPLTRSHSPRALAPAPVGRDRAAPIEPSASPRPLPLARSPAASRLGLASK